MTIVYGSINNKNGLITDDERDLLQENKPGYGTRSKTEGAFSLVNSTVGSGIIGLPFAIYLAGFWTAIILSITVAAISQLGLYMLVLSGQRSGTYKLATLMEHVMGRPGYHFLNFLVLIQAAGACVSYYIRDTIPVLLQLYFPDHPNLTQRSLTAYVNYLKKVLPLNLSRSLGALSKWSILSVLCLPVIIIALIWRAPTYAKSHDAPLHWQSPDIFGALGILAFAFACPHVCFSVYLSLKQQAIESWKMTTTLASIITWIVSISFAAIGYLSFGVDVQPNLFLNFPPNDLVVNIARFALGFSMILTIPMAFHPTREVVQKLLGFETAERQPNKIEHYVVTLMLFIIITTLGITIRSLGKVYALIGGFAATCLAYILPSIAYLITRRQPYSTIPIIDNDPSDDEITNIKVPWMIHQDSSSSTSSSITLDPIPKFGLLDVAAVFTLLWGVIVMIFATSGALK
ncbi:hypothetical protein G6F57_002110 [Rhizopus arrhizus]|uniref:Amino acid transporter transmembrane domain-containing protein n=1 Tax=Rhizopus oryzae TaxID=64495 RepID=A0A9P7BVE7_RHIOR|nr:hypothetical protein G6F23_007397 [Rhizopus arrhizus]KAG1410383.1 hypothetical protein G6F58_009169 [Rhizopus delemar]KAG0767934.1 hypothetical protein G6F24_002377 [Rhizopus arrhizus]KAG0795191.1 hypothetical protein G6F21_002302 [Rhizopus arrhizus]KAG0816687.1 hypothetical protein G6F20_003006 [Rhizopus arrhizus]